MTKSACTFEGSGQSSIAFVAALRNGLLDEPGGQARLQGSQVVKQPRNLMPATNRDRQEQRISPPV